MCVVGVETAAVRDALDVCVWVVSVESLRKIITVGLSPDGSCRSSHQDNLNVISAD